MNCPRCKIALLEGTYEGEYAVHCSSCGGFLINQKSLTKILATMSVDIFEKIDINIPIPEIPDIGSVEICPDCGGPMDNYGYMESKTVLIDCCDNCNALWIDALELATMAKMYVSTKKHLQYLRDTEYQGVDLFNVYVYSMALSGAVLPRFKILKYYFPD